MEVRTRVLRDQLGPKLAKEAGANFEEAAEAPVAPLAPPPPRGDRPRRAPPAATPEPQREAAPRKRKHVTVLRAEARDEAAGPRKRIARSATADRKGREVKVERVSLARPVEDAPKPRGRRDAPRAPREAGFGPRAEGRFEKRGPERAPSFRRDRAAGAGTRGETSEHPPRGEFTSRPPRGETSERPPRREFTSRPPRSEAGERPPRREFGPRPPRSEAGERPPRREFASRPPRGETSERPPRREFPPVRRAAKPGRGRRAASSPRVPRAARAASARPGASSPRVPRAAKPASVRRGASLAPPSAQRSGRAPAPA